MPAKSAKPKVYKPEPIVAADNVTAAIARTNGRRTAAEIALYAGFYPAKLAWATEQADATGFDVRRIVGACAAFSPGFNPDDDGIALAWLIALGPDRLPGKDTKHLGPNVPIPYTYDHFALAHAILWGRIDAFDALKRNVKRGEYLRAIMGDPTAWVIDVHCWRDMIGAADRDPVKLATLTENQYRNYREAMVAAGFTSAEQAIIWGDRRAEGQAHKNHAAA